MERAVDKNRSVRIETYAEKQIEITARKLARRYNLPATEAEEIADAFRNAVERRFLATYDETKSSLPTYLSAFVETDAQRAKARLREEARIFQANVARRTLGKARNGKRFRAFFVSSTTIRSGSRKSVLRYRNCPTT